MMGYVFLLTLGLISLTACRISKPGGDPTAQEGVNPAGSTVVSPPLSSVQRPPVTNSSQTVHFDETGRIVEHIVLRLDYFPTPRPDGVSIPTCQRAFDDNKVIGKLTCAASATMQLDITADQVSQRCVTASPAINFGAKRPILLPGCKGTGSVKSVLDSHHLKLEVMN